VNQKQLRIEMLRDLGQAPDGRLETQVRRRLAAEADTEVTLALDWAKTEGLVTRHPGIAVSAEEVLVLTEKGGDWIRQNG
jgi:hypothetical protein